MTLQQDADRLAAERHLRRLGANVSQLQRRSGANVGAAVSEVLDQKGIIEISGPFKYDYLVDSNYGGTEGRVVPTFHGHTYKVYSTIQGAVTHAETVQTDLGSPSIAIIPGTYVETVTMVGSPNEWSLIIFAFGGPGTGTSAFGKVHLNGQFIMDPTAGRNADLRISDITIDPPSLGLVGSFIASASVFAINCFFTGGTGFGVAFDKCDLATFVDCSFSGNRSMIVLNDSGVSAGDSYVKYQMFRGSLSSPIDFEFKTPRPPFDPPLDNIALILDDVAINSSVRLGSDGGHAGTRIRNCMIAGSNANIRIQNNIYVGGADGALPQAGIVVEDNSFRCGNAITCAALTTKTISAKGLVIQNNYFENRPGATAACIIGSPSFLHQSVCRNNHFEGYDVGDEIVDWASTVDNSNRAFHNYSSSLNVDQPLLDIGSPVGHHIETYGNMYAYDVAGTVTITGTGIANKEQITAFAANGELSNTTPDHTNDHITIDNAGKYLVTVAVAIESTGGTSYKIGYACYKNNGATLFEALHGHRNMAGGGGEHGSIMMSAVIDLAAADTLEVWVWNETNTEDIIIDDISLSVVRVGD